MRDAAWSGYKAWIRHRWRPELVSCCETTQRQGLIVWAFRWSVPLKRSLYPVSHGLSGMDCLAWTVWINLQQMEADPVQPILEMRRNKLWAVVASVRKLIYRINFLSPSICPCGSCRPSSPHKRSVFLWLTRHLSMRRCAAVLRKRYRQFCFKTKRPKRRKATQHVRFLREIQICCWIILG